LKILKVSKAPICGLLLLCGASILLLGAAPSSDPCQPPNFPPPVFGAVKVNVRETGAIGDGRTNDTAAINRAIEECNARGGGDVIFPAGTYSAASIHLKSNIRFVLDKDAVISGAGEGYDSPEPNSFEQYQDFGHSHFHNALMWGENIANFAIVGGRVNGGHIIESEPNRSSVGDKVIALKSSRNLLFENVTHESGGHFVYLFNDCENVTLANVTIRKSRDAANFVGCRNVQVHHCNFTGCGDDTIALKSDWALGRKILSENIYVWDSYFESACNALRFGAETTGDFRNVNFWNIGIGRAWKAAIGITSADGGVIDGVNCRNITIKGAACPIFMRVTNKLRSGDQNKRTGAIKNITIANVTGSDFKAGEEGWPRIILIAGRPESRLENIRLENVRIAYRGGRGEKPQPQLRTERLRRYARSKAGGFYIRNVDSLILSDVRIGFEKGESKPALVGSDIKKLILNGFESSGTSPSQTVQLEKIDNLTVHSSPGLKERSGEHVESTLFE
jgi:hypothetical protein